MFVTWWDLNGKHKATAMCARGEDKKQKRQREEETHRSTEVAFQAYGRPLMVVLDFKYLGRVLTE